MICSPACLVVSVVFCLNERPDLNALTGRLLGAEVRDQERDEAEEMEQGL